MNSIVGWIEGAGNSSSSSFLVDIKNYTVSEDASSDLEDGVHAAYRISEWVSIPNSNAGDGHWKGNGSGSATAFSAFLLSFFASDYKESPFWLQFSQNKTHQLLAFNLFSSFGTEGSAPAIASVDVKQKRAIFVRILSVQNKELVKLSRKDYYTKVIIGGQTFLDATQQDHNEISPGWTSIKFIDASISSIDIEIQLWDENDAGSDDIQDINPTEDVDTLKLTFNINSHQLTGDVSQVCDGSQGNCVSEGDHFDSKAQITFAVTEYLLNSTFITLPGGIDPPGNLNQFQDD